jgi:XTP/dITP diphosphohydrolase
LRQLLIATKNAHKTGEIQAILGAGWAVTDLTAHPEIEAPEETGTTFDENAALKAQAASERFPGLVLADDSGLEVDALGGAPGVYSARYAGPDATDATNRAKLLAALTSWPAEERTARFRCAIAVAQNGQVVHTASGAVEGRILDAERGEGGFGYDALFVPTGHAETFAELSGETKNRLSHRARALEGTLPFLASQP